MKFAFIYHFKNKASNYSLTAFINFSCQCNFFSCEF